MDVSTKGTCPNEKDEIKLRVEFQNNHLWAERRVFYTFAPKQPKKPYVKPSGTTAKMVVSDEVVEV